MHKSSEATILSVAAEERRFDHGRFEVFEVDGLSVGRAVYEPGWRWSEHVAPLAGTAWCEVEHVGFVLSGRAGVKFPDGSELALGPGDFFGLPAGHDSWVIGDEEYASLHFLGVDSYVVDSRGEKSDGGGTEPPLVLDIGSAPRSSWSIGCEGTTVLSHPSLHVMHEMMFPFTSEQRHRHNRVVQLYYMLEGRATVDIDGTEVSVNAEQAIELPPGVSHQIRNEQIHPLRFLVVSSAPPREDRIDVSPERSP